MKAVFFTFMTGLLLYSCTQARAHSFYDAWCCSDRDCAPVADDAVEANAGGWLIRATGEIVPYSKALVSPDGHFHVCRPAGKPVKCLYAPGMGS